MLKGARSKAEERFAAAQKKDKEALVQRQKAMSEKMEHIAKLKALRLAKEAEDREAAEAKATAKSGGK